jgi:hypothetical protein
MSIDLWKSVIEMDRYAGEALGFKFANPIPDLHMRVPATEDQEAFIDPSQDLVKPVRPGRAYAKESKTEAKLIRDLKVRLPGFMPS